MFEMFSIWWKGLQNTEQAKNVEATSTLQECFTYVYSLKRGDKLNLDDYFTGKKNNEYKTLVSTENGRADVDKCLLYADLSKLMKMLANRHSVPPADLYILRFNCSPDKVVEAIKNDKFHSIIVEAYDYLDVWRQRNSDSKTTIKTFKNPNFRSLCDRRQSTTALAVGE